tara:strand:+ start:291 stop:992 length:702 start_codon:yes stop_codon:yes gene_type:complete
MNFENKLISGVFIKRYKRFFVDVQLKNKTITAHCPNTGSMFGLLKPGNKVWISKSNNQDRKLKYTLQIIEVNKTKVGINTHLTNKIVLNAFKNSSLNLLGKNEIIKPEVKFGTNSRFDFFISNKKYKAFLEVKNVTLSRKSKIAEFPDAVTSRGTKHINELVLASKKGFKIYLMFVVQRNDCDEFRIARDIDPQYFDAITKAIKKRLKIICYDCKFSTKGIKLNKKLNIKLNG